jgi:diaminopimelate decarboxylase
MITKYRPYLSYKNKQLHFDNINLQALTKKHSTPFYIYSSNLLVENYLNFYNAALENNVSSPLICFALKSNSNHHFLNVLAQLGCGADIVSGGELKAALAAGITGDKIVFSGVGKTSDEIELGLKSNLRAFNVESVEELEMINDLAKKSKKVARVAFRLNPEVHAKTHKHISTGNKTHKFGMLIEDVLNLKAKLKKLTSIKVVGMSIHIGSQLTCLKATKKAIARMCNCALHFKETIEFLDVGGGLGIDYNFYDQPKIPSISEYMHMVQKVIQKKYLSLHPCKLQTLFEPGRIIAAKSGIFVTSVIREKKSRDYRFIIVDGGMNDFIRPTLYSAYHEILSNELSSQKLSSADVVGPICETSDCFATNRKLPPMKEGQLLTICDTGAYGASMASTYNSRPLVSELLIEASGKVVKV